MVQYFSKLPKKRDNLARYTQIFENFLTEDFFQFILYQAIFFGKKDAENLALRDEELCVAAHLFAEEINKESDLVGENLATKGDELYFQDLPIYNKLNISSAKVGEKTATH